MEKLSFLNKICNIIVEGKVFNNPGGGTSVIMSCDENSIAYKRGNSTFKVRTCDLFDAFSNFAGKTVTSSQLRSYKPNIFDSNCNGHSCNCTFFFLLLTELGLAGKIEGKGVRGNPFYLTINSN